MALINDIIQKIADEKKSVFNYKEWESEVFTRIKEICFLGQIDKDSLYLTQLHQIIRECEGDNNSQIHDLTIDEANEFYLTGSIKDYSDDYWKPFSWTFWFINLSKEYVKVITSFSGDKRKSPKDNYGIAYEHSETKVWAQGTNKIMSAEFDIKDSPYKETLQDLIEIVNYSKNHEITLGDWDKKVHQDMRKYFGMINNNQFVDDQYVETARPEIIKIPQKHDKILIRQDIELTNKMIGPNYQEINYAQNGITRKFKKIKELNDYLYSLIDYINENNERLNIKQQIKLLEKHYFSNKWPIPDQSVVANNRFTEELINNHNLRENNKLLDAEEQSVKDSLLEQAAASALKQTSASRQAYTLYELKVQRYRNNVILQADVWEYGIVYLLTNYWENKFCEHF